MRMLFRIPYASGLAWSGWHCIVSDDTLLHKCIDFTLDDDLWYIVLRVFGLQNYNHPNHMMQFDPETRMVGEL